MRHFAALALGIGCTTELPGPVLGEVPNTAFVEVSFPPPPARVETVPPQPSSEDVWIDGEWVWRNGRWAWRSGYWTIPPPQAVFAHSTLRRTKDGTLLLARGTWRTVSGVEIESVHNRAEAQVREGPVVTPHGQLEPAAPNIEPAQ